MRSPCVCSDRVWLLAFLATLACVSARHAVAQEEGADQTLTLVTENIILIATVIGAAASLPILVEFLIDRRKRKERIALSLDDIAVADHDVRLAGLDHLLNDIADLIDRAKNPDAYASRGSRSPASTKQRPSSALRTLPEILPTSPTSSFWRRRRRFIAGASAPRRRWTSRARSSRSRSGGLS
jgi:hypothetical protein